MPTDKSLHKIKNETSGEKPEDDIVRNGNETNLEVPVAPPEINPSTETKPPIPEGNIEVAELNKEKPEDDGENFLEEAIDTLKQTLRGKKKKPTQVPQMKDEVTVEIEKIMEQDLKEAYRELTPIQKQEFKMKGEEIAYKIRDLLKKTHVRVKSVFRLILEWLKMLPGINKFFLEQEAKIKTDKILAIQDRGKQK